MSTTPIKIKKLKEAGVLIYPATILDAVKDATAKITVNDEQVDNPDYGKSLRELLAEAKEACESGVNGLQLKYSPAVAGVEGQGQEGEEGYIAPVEAAPAKLELLDKDDEVISSMNVDPVLSEVNKRIDDLESDNSTKIANSKTLAEVTVGEGEESVTSLETAVRIVYVDAVAGTPAVGDDPEAEDYVPAVPGVPAHIALVDKDGKELSTVDVSDLVANGFLKSSDYDSTTGQLTLTFAQADGADKDVEIDLAKMLDIDDVLIAEDSQDYLDVVLNGGEQSDAVFSAKVVNLEDTAPAGEEYVNVTERVDGLSTGDYYHADSLGTWSKFVEDMDLDYQFEHNTGEVFIKQMRKATTGLADAANVKAYVDQNAADLAVSAEGDDVYVTAAVDADDNKKINVAAKIVNIADATMGVEAKDAVGEEGDDDYQPAVEAQPKVTGLLDAADAKKYIDDSIESLSMVSLTAEAINEVEYDDVF